MSNSVEDNAPIVIVVVEGKFAKTEILISDINIVDITAEDGSDAAEMQYNYTINKLYINDVEKTLEDNLEEYDNNPVLLQKDIEGVISSTINQAISKMLEDFTTKVVDELDGLDI